MTNMNRARVRALVLVYAQPQATTIDEYNVGALCTAILEAVQGRTNFDRLYVVSPIYGHVRDAEVA